MVSQETRRKISEGLKRFYRTGAKAVKETADKVRAVKGSAPAKNVGNKVKEVAKNATAVKDRVRDRAIAASKNLKTSGRQDADEKQAVEVFKNWEKYNKQQKELDKAKNILRDLPEKEQKILKQKIKEKEDEMKRNDAVYKALEKKRGRKYLEDMHAKHYPAKR